MNVDQYVDPSVTTGDGYDAEDNGTMPENLAALADAVVGHRIVKVEKGALPRPDLWGGNKGHVITLDNGKRVQLTATSDCCAYTEIEDFLFNVDKIDHIITGVKSEDGYTKWHVYCDLGDVLQMTVGWSPGNPFYYGYGLDISVVD